MMKQIGSNEKCPCGSGKKYIKCCANKKQRHIGIAGIIQKSGTIRKIEVSSEGLLKMYTDDGEINLQDPVFESSYMKENGEHKFLNRIPINDNLFITDPMKLLINFDAIFAIDTNTKEVNGKRVSVSSRQYCFKHTQTELNVHFIIQSFGIVCAYDFEIGKEERQAIAILIEQIISHPNYDNNHDIAIVTDHDLGNLIKYNKREIPIYNEIYLPNNFKLIYAYDGVKDTILNQLISACDKESNDFFKKLINGQIEGHYSQL